MPTKPMSSQQLADVAVAALSDAEEVCEEAASQVVIEGAVFHSSSGPSQADAITVPTESSQLAKTERTTMATLRAMLNLSATGSDSGTPPLIPPRGSLHRSEPAVAGTQLPPCAPPADGGVASDSAVSAPSTSEILAVRRVRFPGFDDSIGIFDGTEDAGTGCVVGAKKLIFAIPSVYSVDRKEPTASTAETALSYNERRSLEQLQRLYALNHNRCSPNSDSSFAADFGMDSVVASMSPKLFSAVVLLLLTNK
jgi:hypothetical protein